jgi:hypothetical protein
MNAELCFREFDFFEIYFLFKIDDQFNSVECENLYEMSLVDSNTFEIFDLFSLVPISFRFLFLYFLLSIRACRIFKYSRVGLMVDSRNDIGPKILNLVLM